MLVYYVQDTIVTVAVFVNFTINLHIIYPDNHLEIFVSVYCDMSNRL